jgi:hypothetical protein
MKNPHPPVKPIRPEEVAAKRLETIPDFVIDTINDLIVLYYSPNGFEIFQQDIKQELLRKTNGFNIKPCWLNLEELYSEAGWEVRLIKGSLESRPGVSYNSYLFKPKKVAE